MKIQTHKNRKEDIMAEIKINNSKESAVDGKWSKPSSKYYDALKHSKKLLDEAFLIVGEKAGEDCSFSASGCKYPHHVIKDDELVLSIPGVKAAYSRAKQMGQFSGDLKSHLERHYKELGLYEGSTMESDKAIEENFAFIESYLGISFMESDPETMLHEYGDNPEDLIKWLYRNIQCEECDEGWKLRSPEEMISEGKGTSHDQALFEMEMFHHMGLNCGRIFCMEYNKESGTSKWTHTICWYGEENSVSVYWFENCWKGHYGIHGPYNGIETLMNEVEKVWKKDNPESEYGLYFSTEGDPTVGMSLPEYATSWSIIKSIKEQMEWIESFVHDEEFRESVMYITEAGRSKKLKPNEVHKYDKEIREMIGSMSKQDRKYIGHGYWIDTEKVIYRRIVKEDGAVVGFIDVLGKLPKIEGNQGTVIVAVDKYHRNEGYGKRLVSRTVSDFKKGKIDVENLRWVSDIGNEKSQSLAESNGFKKASSTEEEIEYKLFRKKEKEFKESTEEDGEKLTYADEDEELKPVYVVLKSYSFSNERNDGTPKTKDELGSVKFAKISNKFGKGDNYSHALLSLNLDLTNMYSFEGSGFVKESILNKDSWMGTKSIYIAVQFLKESDFKRVKSYIKYLEDHQSETTYAFSNFLTVLFSKHVTHQNRRQFCSSFVGYILQLSDPKNTHRDYSRQRPEECAIYPRTFYVGNVVDRVDLIKNLPLLKKKVEEIQKDHEEEIREYNNELPKLLLKEHHDKLSGFDKFFNFLTRKKKPNTH